MSKLFTKIASIAAGVAMAAAIGISLAKEDYAKADAAEVLAYTLDGTTTGGNNGYATESDITQNDILWKVTGNTTTNPWRFGGKNISSVDRTAYSTLPINETITKMDLVVGSASNITVNSLKLTVASDASFGTVVEEVSKTFAANSTITFPSSKTWKDCYYKLTFNVTVSDTSNNRFVQFSALKFYKESSAILQNISLSKNSVSGYVVGNTFGKTEFLATGITVSANYDSGSPINVTNDVSVTSTTLTDGNNSVTISYGGKNATLTVNARTQDAIDTDSAHAFDNIVDIIDDSEIGSGFVDPLNDALTTWAGMTSGAKSKATAYDDLESYVNANSNYVIFNNALAEDNTTDIFKDGIKGAIPESWLVPSIIDITAGAYLYNGANSKAKIGKSDASGTITIALKDNSHIFTSLKVGLTKFGTDTGTVSISGFEDNVAPTIETSLVDISSEKISEITIATSAKRAYINYIYFTEAANADSLDPSITKTGTLAKTVYIAGQSFDSTGLSFSVSYNSGASSKVIDGSHITWLPNPLTAGTTQVTGTYTEGAQSATITITGLTVNPYVNYNYGQVGKAVANYAGEYYFTHLDVTNHIWNPISAPEATFSSLTATVANNVIASTVNLDDAIVTIEAVAGGYVLKNANGEYLGPNKTGFSSGVVNAVIREEAVVHSIEGINEEGIVQISAKYDDETVVYLRFNQASNQLKARYYADVTKVKGFTLFKKNATAVNSLKQDVDLFVETYLHMTDYTESLGYCKDSEHHYYVDAKEAFLNLSAAETQYFLDNYDNAIARLSAWATANSETFDTVNGTFEVVRINNPLANKNNNNSVIYIVIGTSISLVALCAFVVLRKKRI